MTVQPPATSSARTLFLYIPVTRLVILSIASGGLYEAYWIYKNWQYIKRRKNLKIKPFWRGVFGVLFCFALLRRIHGDDEARAVLIPRFAPGLLAVGWILSTILANILGRVPGSSFTVIALLMPSFLFFVPVQAYVNSVVRKQNPNASYYGWSTGHILCLIIGIIGWMSVLVAAIKPV
jgi:hypothetical protein